MRQPEVLAGGWLAGTSASQLPSLMVVPCAGVWPAVGMIWATVSPEME